MNKKIHKIIFLSALFLILYLPSCKEQGQYYLSWRNIDGNVMINVYNAYLHLSAVEDSILFTAMHYAEVMADIYDINDSVRIVAFGHCWSPDTTKTPSLINTNLYTKFLPGEGDYLTITPTDSAFTYISQLNDLGIDSPYVVRSFVIIRYQNSGLVDTAYNQITTKFRTRVPEDVWFHNDDYTISLSNARTEATAFVMNNKVYLTCGYNGFSLLKDFWKYNPTDDTWTQLADFRGDPRMSAVAFVINDTAYVGTGIIDYNLRTKTGDMWKWSEVGGMYNNWTRIDSLGPGMERANAIGFALTVDDPTYGEEGRGYLGLGETTYPRHDLLYYNFRADTAGADPGKAWVTIDPFIGGYRTEAVVSVLNNVAIVGSGMNTEGTLKSDFYTFDASLGSYGRWASIVESPADPRANAVSFSLSFERVNGNGYNYFYYGTGRGENDSLYNDWWAYDFSQGTWKQCCDIREEGDIAPGRQGAVAFAITREHVEFGTLERGFVVSGRSKTTYLKDVWEYLP